MFTILFSSVLLQVDEATSEVQSSPGLLDQDSHSRHSSCNFDPLTLTLLCKSLDGISLWSLVFTVEVCREHSSHSASTWDSWPPLALSWLLPQWVTPCFIPARFFPFSSGLPCMWPGKERVNWFEPVQWGCRPLTTINHREQFRADNFSLCFSLWLKTGYRDDLSAAVTFSTNMKLKAMPAVTGAAACITAGCLMPAVYVVHISVDAEPSHHANWTGWTWPFPLHHHLSNAFWEALIKQRLTTVCVISDLAWTLISCWDSHELEVSTSLESATCHDYVPPWFPEYAASILHITSPFSKHCLGSRWKQKLSFIPPIGLWIISCDKE